MKMRRFIGAAAAMAVAGTLTVGAAAETYNAYIGSPVLLQWSIQKLF